MTQNSDISEDRFRELMMKTGELAMDVGTSIDGETAVQEGLIDELGGLSDAIECLYRMIEEREAEEPDHSGLDMPQDAPKKEGKCCDSAHHSGSDGSHDAAAKR